MVSTVEWHTGQAAGVPAADLKADKGECVMIPAKLLKLVADQLTAMTQTGKAQWGREKHDREHYSLRVGQVSVVLRYHPARVEANVIEFAVLNYAMEEIGTLLADEEDKENYNALSELLFAIQRSENRGGMREVTDELIKLLPEPDRQRWIGKQP